MLEGGEYIIDIKKGKSHLVALTSEGRVFSWGNNNYGQIGIMNKEENPDIKASTVEAPPAANKGKKGKLHLPAFKKEKEVTKTVWQPVLIYPREDDEDNKMGSLYDPGAQIEVYNNSNFLLTREGKLWSWGDNKDNFLGRETKVDLHDTLGGSKSLSDADHKKALSFSTCLPGQVEKLKNYTIEKIKIVEGKFFAFFTASPIAPESEQEMNSDEEEEKMDVVPDLIDGGLPTNLVKAGSNQLK